MLTLLLLLVGLAVAISSPASTHSGEQENNTGMVVNVRPATTSTRLRQKDDIVPLLGSKTPASTSWSSNLRNDPDKPLFFEQIVDHRNPKTSGTYLQRYYENLNHWRGPGHPIFIILGGENELQHIAYPFISEVLAAHFGAYTIEPEHRYFGASYPIKKPTKEQIAQQLTPRQALQDAITIIKAKQKELGCGPPGSSSKEAPYCPVVAVGGSYSGLLATLIRMSYPDIVDIAYGAGACLRLFDHSTDPYQYYEYISKVADRASPGCSEAVHDTLVRVQEDLTSSNFSSSSAQQEYLNTKAAEYGICPNLPSKYVNDGDDLADAIIHFNSFHFGDTNMDYYPPGPQTVFAKSCAIFQATDKSIQEKVKNYFLLIDNVKANNTQNYCHDLQPKVSGEGSSDDLWGALTCYTVPRIGKSNRTMWFPEKYDAKDAKRSCKKDYGIDMDKDYMNHEFDLTKNLQHVTRLLLTNGVNDGWYDLSYTDHDGTPLGSGVVVKNFETGAHHSELRHFPIANTPEIELGHIEIAELMSQWLEEVRNERGGSKRNNNAGPESSDSE